MSDTQARTLRGDETSDFWVASLASTLVNIGLFSTDEAARGMARRALREMTDSGYDTSSLEPWLHSVKVQP